MNIESICKSAREASHVLSGVTSEEKSEVLYCMANAIREFSSIILAANQKDMHFAKQKKLSSSFLDRLQLNNKRIEEMANGLEIIAKLPEPVGKILAKIVRPNQLEILRVSVPLGVIGVIYESRPNVTADAGGLCLKSGNAVILRCGSESIHSSLAIHKAMQNGIMQTNLPVNAVQIIPTTDREMIDEILKMDKYIDVIIPRGGMNLIQHISSNTKIPVFKHLAGICHTYIHQSADKQMARKIILNAKMRRTGICGATEVLLVDSVIANLNLPDIINDLYESGCEIRGDEKIIKIDDRVKLATTYDFDTEFLDAIIAVKIVKDIDEAISHIANHGTQHTDAIISEDMEAANKFLRDVDSAIVMHNTSTQFADGNEFGMGSEIGIATGKLHARGPVGVEQLTTFKYLVKGNGQIRS